MTSSAKTYSLRSGQQIINIPGEFDDQLLQEAKINSAKTAQAKVPPSPQESPLQSPQVTPLV